MYLINKKNSKLTTMQTKGKIRFNYFLLNMQLLQLDNDNKHAIIEFGKFAQFMCVQSVK